MAAQANQPIPLSAIFEAMSFTGKDKVMPLLIANEEKYDQMRQLAAQMEQIGAANQVLAQENQNLKAAVAAQSEAMFGEARASPSGVY